MNQKARTKNGTKPDARTVPLLTFPKANANKAAGKAKAKITAAMNNGRGLSPCHVPWINAPMPADISANSAKAAMSIMSRPLMMDAK